MIVRDTSPSSDIRMKRGTPQFLMEMLKIEIDSNRKDTIPIDFR